MEKATEEKLDLLSGIVGNFSLDNFVIFKAKGITILRDFDAMSDAEKHRVIDALTYQDEPTRDSDDNA